MPALSESPYTCSMTPPWKTVTTPIILIGPMCTGKSTLAALLAGRLALPRVELDDIRWDYYTEAGYNDDDARSAHESGGTLAFLAYCKPFEAYAVERALDSFSAAVIDFGAGHTVQDDPTLAKRVAQALAPHPNVILPLPSPDPARSIEVLNRRLRKLLLREVGSVDESVLEINAHFITHPANHSLAKHILFTEGEEPAETCQRILALIQHGTNRI